MVLVQKGEERREGAVVETVITVLGGVTGNVSQCPDAGRHDNQLSPAQVLCVVTYACSRTSALLALNS